ncbi:hypothetical protein V5E97_24770 [Singulisphaera sp. Ch08]|uniref:Uncharacterized protein n=1 Tax=Singulisphaera sp. Ch08 TaxID=3120278 RepID=A0AAU7C824_9BACT
MDESIGVLKRAIKKFARLATRSRVASLMILVALVAIAIFAVQKTVFQQIG